MPQIDLLLADTDRVELLHWTLEQGAVLVPVMHYHEPHYEEVRSAAKLEQFLSRRQFYVLRGDWQSEKLRMEPYVNNFKGAGFYIAQRQGGPSLSYLLYPQREESGHAILGGGAIHYYPFYYSSSNGQQQLAPNDSLKEFYAEATRVMKKGGSRIKGRQRSVWVARDGAKLLASKQAAAPGPWSDVAEDVGRS
jgi:hypothetical protein